MSTSLNCYTCKHRKPVVGSAHSECVHPVCEIPELKFVMMLSLAQGIMRKNPTGILLDDEPAQEWREIGLRNGYVLFPFNFDPAWLIKCKLHEQES